MKKAELIKLLQKIPDDAEIVVAGHSCDILGQYYYEDYIKFEEIQAVHSRNTYMATFSNDAPKDAETIKLYLLT